MLNISRVGIAGDTSVDKFTHGYVPCDAKSLTFIVLDTVEQLVLGISPYPRSTARRLYDSAELKSVESLFASADDFRPLLDSSAIIPLGIGRLIRAKPE